jgi:hypothetical protein
MHDAVALANWVRSLEGTFLAHVKAIFKEYYEERFPIAKETFATSQMLSKIPGKVRYLAFILIPLPASTDHEAHSIAFA